MENCVRVRKPLATNLKVKKSRVAKKEDTHHDQGIDNPHDGWREACYWLSQPVRARVEELFGGPGLPTLFFRGAGPPRISVTGS